jgi:hypothetical protein
MRVALMENVVPGYLQRLRAADIIRMAGLTTASVGQEYYRAGAVRNMSRRGALLAGIVELPQTQANNETSSEMVPHRFPVEVEFVEAGVAEGQALQPPASSWLSKCACSSGTEHMRAGVAQDQAPLPPAHSLLCAHAAALLYQWLAQPSLFQTPAKSELVSVKSTRKNEVIDIAADERTEAVGIDVAQDQTPQPPAPIPAEAQMGLPMQRHSVGSTRLTQGIGKVQDTGQAKITGQTKGMGRGQDAGQAQGPAPTSSTENILALLSQLSLGDLRAMAREYNVAVGGMSRQQLAESMQAQLRRSDAVRRVAATLEKSPRQLLAALILAGGMMSDDDLRGLFERFSLGQPGHLHHVLLTLQSKALLFRVSLNASNLAQGSHHGLLNSALLDIGWYVPLGVRSALRVAVPVTPFDVTNVDVGSAPVEQSLHAGQDEKAGQATPLPMLFLVARLLDGYTPDAHETWYERGDAKRSSEVDRSGRDSSERLWHKVHRPDRAVSNPQHLSNSSIAHALDVLSTDGSVAMPSPEDLLPAPLLRGEGAGLLPLQPALLRFIIRVLSIADLFEIADGQSPTLSLRSGTAERLLGPDWPKTLRTLFNLWLTQASYGDLYDLNEEDVRLRCRAYVGQGQVGQSHGTMHQPLLRSSELEAENSQARQFIVALLAQTPLNQWISFSAFARFVYRLNPLFLQRHTWGRAAAPQWWLEREEGRPLRPLQLNDWLRGELFYLRRMIAGPLHWWGACDIVMRVETEQTSDGTGHGGDARHGVGARHDPYSACPAPTGELLAFRLTPMAGWLFNAGAGPVQPPRLEEELQEGDDYLHYAESLEITDASEILVSCSVQNWPVIQLLEMFTEVAGVGEGRRRMGEGQEVTEFGLAPNLPPLRYRVSAKAFGQALGRGLHPFALVRLLRLAAEVKADSDTRQAQRFIQIATQLEQWLAGYGRVRLYTGVTLLETVDAAVMREVVATTSLEEAIAQNIHSTLCIVRPHKIGHIVDELKQRGQSTLLHDEDL